MTSWKADLDEFGDALGAIDPSALTASVSLSPAEVGELRAGMDRMADPIRSVCLALLDQWEELDNAARTAGLLVLANALADACSNDEGKTG